MEEERLTSSVFPGQEELPLSARLEKYLREASEEERKKRIADIERSIIKTKRYRRTVWRPFTKAVTRYDLIQEGDKIAVCISGGKDSFLLAKLMQEILRHGKVHFDLVFLCMDPGYREENRKVIECNARIMGIPLTVFNSQIFEVVDQEIKSPCYLCARMRRGYLYSRAKALGCNKIALGHHFDDMIETVLMGMLYSGKVETMMPKLHSTNFEGMELIRPLYMIHEEDIKAWRDFNDLHFIQCACRITERNAAGDGMVGSKREEIKRMIASMKEYNPHVDTNIFNSVHNINLANIIGYHKGDMAYNFLDDYQDRGKVKAETAEDAGGETSSGEIAGGATGASSSGEIADGTAGKNSNGKTAVDAGNESSSGCDGAAGSKDHAAYEDPADYQFQHISVY